MERFCVKSLVFLSLLAALPVSAGTLLWTPPEAPLPEATAHRYPVSRFGQPPAQPGTEHRSDWDVQDSGRLAANSERSGASRSPAGMMSPDTPREGVKGSTEPLPSSYTEAMAIRKSGVQEVAVIAGDLGFFPKTVFVTRDIPVRLFVTGASKGTLCIMMDSFQVRKQVRSQKVEEITFTPGTPGKYRFYCPVNGMEGSLVVKELTSNL